MKKDTNIIVRVDSTLKENVMKIIKKKGYTLSDIITACLSDIEQKGMVPFYLNRFLPRIRKNSEGYISIGFIKMCLEEIIKNNEEKKIKKVYLFGSYARGEEKPSSDIDLRIEPGENLTLVDLGNMRQNLVKKLNKDVDLLAIDSSKLDPDFYRKVRKEEICLYECE